MKRLVSILLVISVVSTITWSQNIDSCLANRFNYNGENNFRKYLAENSDFPEAALTNQGVLLPGMVLKKNGDIQQVFCLNSLHPDIDNYVLDLFENSSSYWEPDSAETEPIIFIVPIVYSLGRLKVKIHKDNFRLPVLDEIYVTALGPIAPSEFKRSSQMEKKYEKFMSRNKYEKANQIILDLLKREPLNVDYYKKYIATNEFLGNKEIVNQTENFIESYFIEK